MIKNVRVGADPELFVEKNGEIISVETLVGGTKEEPKKISKRGHAIQEDNVMVEYNIPPCDSAEEFVEELEFVEDYLETFLALKGVKLNYSASAELAKKWLKTDQAKMFGCEPDYNLYKEDFNPTPNPSTNLRTAGGHIHVGYENPQESTSELIVFAMDVMLGLPSVELDTDHRRKEMYGNAGSFRFKTYGVEYRTLSNFWLENSETKAWAYNQTMKAIELANNPALPAILTDFGAHVEKAINTNNAELAARLDTVINELTLTKIEVENE